MADLIVTPLTGEDGHAWNNPENSSTAEGGLMGDVFPHLVDFH